MLSKYKKNLLLLAGVIFLFALGLFFGLNSWNKKLYVSWNPSSQRGLAEDNQTEFLIEISSEELAEKADKVLFDNVRLIEEEDKITFYLKSILVPDKSTGKYRFLCEIFSHIEFSFAPLGIKLSGDPGLMILQSPCRQEEEFELGPFFIFKKKLLGSADKRNFEFEELGDYMSFYKASILLTPSWILKTIRFFNESEEDSEEFIVRYNPENNSPFEIVLKEEANPPQLILKEQDLRL